MMTLKRCACGRVIRSRQFQACSYCRPRDYAAYKRPGRVKAGRSDLPPAYRQEHEQRILSQMARVQTEMARREGDRS